MKRPAPRRHIDATAVAQRAVLTTVLAIAATASYIHLREVWEAAAAPIPTFSPLLVDGLFAAAWLRIRERRVARVAVGWLAWAALLLALAATVAGNLSAAWISGQRDPLSLIVATWPAIAFALVWELVTSNSAKRRHPSPPLWETGGEPPAEGGETWDQKRDRLLGMGVGRKRLARELGVSEHAARLLLEARTTEVEDDATEVAE